MSIENKLERLVLHLLNETVNGHIKWDNTADDTTFRIMLPSGVVRIEEVQGEDSDGVPTVRYVFTVSDKKGQVVEQFTPSCPGEAFSACPRLYEAARRSARRTEEVIDSLLRETGSTT